MERIKQCFENNYLLGYIKYKGSYELYLMPIAWWILNYKKYDPESVHGDLSGSFRDDIYNVTDNVIQTFMNAIEIDKISLTELEISTETVDKDFLSFYFFIDFDLKLFISSFPEIEVETYLPDGKWTGKFDLPLKYLPRHISENLPVQLSQ